MSKLQVTQRKSRNGCDKRQLDTLRSLGLRRIGQTVEHDDSPQIRGMIHKVRTSSRSPGGCQWLSLARRRGHPMSARSGSGCTT